MFAILCEYLIANHHHERLTTMAGKRLSEAIDEYLTLRQARRGGALHRKHNTARADQNALLMFLRMSGDRVLTHLTPEHVEQWFYGPGGIRDTHKIDSKRGGRNGWAPPVSEATHNHYRSRLSTFFKWCQQRGYLKRDVMAHTYPLKVPKVSRQRPDPVTLLRLLEAADNPRDRIYLAIAVNTALRASEIQRLKVGAVDLQAGILHSQIFKTGDYDELPITSDLDAELRAWLVAYAEGIQRPLDPEDYLIPRRVGGLIHHYETSEDGERRAVREPLVFVPDQYVEQTHFIVQKALRKLGLPTKKEGTHTIRRAVARAYFDSVSTDKGDVAALRETSALLHHAATSTTEVYLGLTPEKNARDRRMKGQPFLTAMVNTDNVVPIQRKTAGE